MTSKISCARLILEDIRKRSWLTALTSVIFFLIIPVNTMLYLSSRSEELVRSSSRSSIAENLPGLLNGDNGYLFIILALLPILSAMTGFSYIHSREKMDFYHALPVRREKWFSSAYLAGLIILLVPYLICTSLAAAIGAASDIMSPEAAANCTLAAAGGILAMFVIYNSCVLAVMLTGRTATALLASLAVMVYPLLIVSNFTSLQATFFKTYSSGIVSFPEKLALHISPVSLFDALISDSAGGTLGALLLISTALVSVLLITGAVLLYRMYPSEAAGNTLPFPLAAPIAKVLICIPTAIFIASMTQELTLTSETLWLLPLSLFFAVLLCAVTEFIYHNDMKMLLKGWRSSLITIGGTALILCIFQFDLTGYDTYLPERGEIEAISFHPDSFSQYFSYPETVPYYTSELGYFVPAEYTDLLYELAENGIDNLKSGINAQDSYSDDFDSSRYAAVLLQYKLSGGNTVMRRYAVNIDKAENALRELLQSEDYRRDIFPIFHVDRSDVSDIYLTNLYGQEEAADLDKAQYNALLDAYEKDVLSVSADTLIDGTPVGELTLYLPDPYQADTAGEPMTISLPMLYIYSDYTNTLNLLEDYGCTLRSEIDPQEVESITFTLSSDSWQNGDYGELVSSLSDNATVTTYNEETRIETSDPEDISLILEYTEPYSAGIMGNTSFSSNYVDIWYRNGNTFGYATQAAGEFPPPVVSYMCVNPVFIDSVHLLLNRA